MIKKILLAAVAMVSIGAASSSFAGGCGTSYVTVQKHCPAPTYVYQQPCHQQVITYPVYQPVHVEKKVIIQQPCHTTYVKPCVPTYMPAPVEQSRYAARPDETISGTA
ncbi:MAG: hypothetical protein P1V20_19345, partial [Verrucomicrobiales bacterium]|nr:hypothetical protein [Verrucomicrobiales bacterium]